MLGKAAIAVVLTLAVIGTTGQILFPPKPILFYNPTNSAAVGWYKIKPNAEIVSGVQVAAFAPEWARGCFGTRYASKVGLYCPEVGGVYVVVTRCAGGFR